MSLQSFLCLGIPTECVGVSLPKVLVEGTLRPGKRSMLRDVAAVLGTSATDTPALRIAVEDDIRCSSAFVTDRLGCRAAEGRHVTWMV